MSWQTLIRDIPDWPKPGILFRDITPLLADAAAFAGAVDALASAAAPWQPDAIVAIEARGFIFGAALAQKLGCGFVPVRKRGKLPFATVREEYALEYGTDMIEIHADALAPGRRAVLVDDLLATGGTAAACARLVRTLGAELAGMVFLIELTALNGRSRLPADVPAAALLAL